MNSIVALPILTAVPTVAPAMPRETVGPNGQPRPHPDAELIALSKQYEEFLAIEVSLHHESERLFELAERLRYEMMGVDPADVEACNRAAKERWSEWLTAMDEAQKKVRRTEATVRWSRATERTARIGKKIMRIHARTAVGLQIKARVIETHDEVCKMEPVEQLIAEIKAFAAAA